MSTPFFSLAVRTSIIPEDSGISFDAGTRAFKMRILARATREVVRIRLGKIDRFAFHSCIGLILNVEYRLWTTRRHFSIRTKDGHLVLQRGYIECSIARIVVRWHLSSNLIRSMRLHPLQGFDISIHQLLDNVLVAVDIIITHKDADERIRSTKSSLG